MYIRKKQNIKWFVFIELVALVIIIKLFTKKADIEKAREVSSHQAITRIIVRMP